MKTISIHVAEKKINIIKLLSSRYGYVIMMIANLNIFLHGNIDCGYSKCNLC